MTNPGIFSGACLIVLLSGASQPALAINQSPFGPALNSSHDRANPGTRLNCQVLDASQSLYATGFAPNVRWYVNQDLQCGKH